MEKIEEAIPTEAMSDEQRIEQIRKFANLDEDQAKRLSDIAKDAARASNMPVDEVFDRLMRGIERMPDTMERTLEIIIAMQDEWPMPEAGWQRFLGDLSQMASVRHKPGPLRSGAMAPAESGGHVHPRGISRPRKQPELRMVLQAINEQAQEQCGLCEGPLLPTWGWCPTCGSKIEWEANERPDSQG